MPGALVKRMRSPRKTMTSPTEAAARAQKAHVKDLEYQWTIASEDDRIYQNFAFYDSEGRVTLEQHEQRVYEPAWILAELKNAGFQVEVYTDFTQAGICEGEKQFYICRKAGGIQ